MLRLIVELPLASVNVHRRPLAVAVIVTQLVTRRVLAAVRSPESIKECYLAGLPTQLVSLLPG